jgi:two-component system nitrate/nitrite response regulator NarL
VLILSAHDESHLVYEAHAAGASGFLSTLTPEATVCDGIAAVARGESVLPQELQPGLLAEIRGRHEADRPRLTDREQEILRLLADGLSAPRIAEALHLSPATVRTYLQGLYEKLGVSTQAAAVAVAMRQGLLE